MIRKLSFVAALSLAAACGGSTAPAATSQPTEAVVETATEEVETVVEEATADLRVIHASPASPIHVRANGQVITEDALTSGTWTSTRITVPAGPHAITVGPSGGGEAFAAADVELEGEGNYTLFFIGDNTANTTAAAPMVVLASDDLTAPEGDTAHVRFVHAVPGGAEVAISSPSGRGYAAGVGFGGASDFYPVAVTDNSFDVAIAGSVVASAEVPLTAGLLTTIIFVAEGEGIGTLVVSEGAE